MTEATQNESAVVVSSEAKSTFHEKIVERKTIVYETLVDPAVIRIAAENLKDELFTKYGFLKPQLNEITLVSLEKKYQPFILTTGKYFIDYYRKRTIAFKVDEKVSEVVFGFGKFSSKLIVDSFGTTHKGIELSAEERLQDGTQVTLTMDALGNEVSLKQLPSAPTDKNSDEILSKLGDKQVQADFEVAALRNRIQKCPADVNWIESEAFEITERLVIYTPRFQAVYKNTRTGRERAAEFDGVTGKLIRVGEYQQGT